MTIALTAQTCTCCRALKLIITKPIQGILYTYCIRCDR